MMCTSSGTRPSSPRASWTSSWSGGARRTRARTTGKYTTLVAQHCCLCTCLVLGAWSDPWAALHQLVHVLHYMQVPASRQACRVEDRYHSMVSLPAHSSLALPAEYARLGIHAGCRGVPLQTSYYSCCGYQVLPCNTFLEQKPSDPNYCSVLLGMLSGSENELSKTCTSCGQLTEARLLEPNKTMFKP
jgi:hypothetical protein